MIDDRSDRAEISDLFNRYADVERMNEKRHIGLPDVALSLERMCEVGQFTTHEAEVRLLATVATALSASRIPLWLK
jgi:hypothetical protein